MEIVLVDTWRSVTMRPPTGGPAAPALATIARLSIGHTNANPHLEFRADKEFIAALLDENKNVKTGESFLATADKSGRSAWTGSGVVPVRTYKGIPIVPTGA